MLVYYNNFFYIFKGFKKTYNKNIDYKSNIFSDKFQLNYKYIKTNQNQKLKTQFFGLFQVFIFCQKTDLQMKAF